MEPKTRVSIWRFNYQPYNINIGILSKTANGNKWTEHI